MTGLWGFIKGCVEMPGQVHPLFAALSLLCKSGSQDLRSRGSLVSTFPMVASGSQGPEFKPGFISKFQDEEDAKRNLA